jgi:hypothetical protein
MGCFLMATTFRILEYIMMLAALLENYLLCEVSHLDARRRQMVTVSSLQNIDFISSISTRHFAFRR